ncbi:MAG: polysaccharide export protein [Proteobacteria bacterium]|uniref:polysaccharide biosynthesis/export family protein n=1 Tax=Aquabacterium sp. TaxID=1872578 RepID=UPI0035C75280|nr:polysaccharide export protein [Pseudomonadota bacterium]
MNKPLASLLASFLAVLMLSACVPPGVLQAPQGFDAAPHMITPAQLAALPRVPTRVRAGDTLRIVRDAQDSASLDLRNLVDDSQTLNYVVRADGTIAFRYAGRIEAAGKTPEELAQSLRDKLAVYYREPGVTVNIVNSPSSKVVIGGAVRAPITLDLYAVSNLEQALFAAGGLLPGADPARLALLRLDEQDRYRVHLIDFSNVLQPQEGGRAAIALQRGDIVFVPKSSAGASADGVDLYFNQLLPFSRALGVNATANVN